MGDTLCRETELIENLRQRLSAGFPYLISIDGVDGVGKSTLASNLAEELSAKHIEIDSFVKPHQGGYVGHIDYDRLQEEINQAREMLQTVIFEGICVRQILERIGLKPDVSVYIKVIDHDGFWMDEVRLFPPGRTVEEIMEARIESRRKANSLFGEEPTEAQEGHTEEIIRYHYAYQPHVNTDYVFARRRKDA